MRAVGAMRLARVAGHMDGGRLMSAHIPVMRDRVVELMRPAVERAEPIVVDATLGAGGHAEALLLAFPGLYLIGIDRDTDALAQARSRLHRFDGRTELTHAIYDEIGEVLDGRTVAAVLFDLGVSSMQLDRAARGFSYAHDAPLDMRMDPGTGRTAADVLADEDADSLASILSRYGQEKFARRIAATIVRRRDSTAFTRSSQLVDAVRDSIPAAARRTGGNPAKRTFQALRIEVNDELRALGRALPDALESVDVGGRVIAMAYHSLEDRIVKRTFAAHTTVDVPRHLPVTSINAKFTPVTRGAEQAGAEEVEVNPRAKPVRLRAIERTAA